jgi:hypothetical protein
MKISKASWMILGAGVFIIALTGLGVARYGQVQDQKKLTSDLALSTSRLNNLQVVSAQPQIDDLENDVADVQKQVEEIKVKLLQSVISVDVTDKFYEIAGFYNVTVNSIGTSTLSEQPFADISCDVISLSATVNGTMDKIVDFVKGLNDNFSTGFIRSAQINASDPLDTSVSVQMIVYSYRSNQDGK